MTHRMRRDHFTLAVTNIDPRSDDPPSDGPPTVVLTYEGPAGNLTAHLAADGEPPVGDEVDVAFRLQDPIDADESSGVFSLTHRLTGQYFLEAHAQTADLLALVDTAREDEGAYRIHIERPGAEDILLEKETLLVYDPEGSLLRQDSLIPSGVEL
ncbi:MAG: hypothetical protein ACI8XM_002271 [Haloarculaceae archaeon]|jgi:hypothetical protein